MIMNAIVGTSLVTLKIGSAYLTPHTYRKINHYIEQNSKN